MSPADENELWSDDWEGGEDEGTWASNLPAAYRDDLTSDSNPLPFAIGSARGSDLQVGEYWVNFDTNEGRTDSGAVEIRGQATTRATDPAEEAYCLSHFNEDAACMFAADTTPVPPNYYLGTASPGTRALWGTCPPPYEPYPANGVGGLAY